MAQKAGNACSVLLHRMASLAAIELFIKLEVHLLNWVPIRTRGVQGVAVPGMARGVQTRRGLGQSTFWPFDLPWRAFSPAKTCDFIDWQLPPP